MPPRTDVPAATSVKPHQCEREKMRKIISVAALLLALTCPAYAGEIQNDSPKPPTSTAQEPTNGVMTTGDIQNDAADTLTQITLNLLAVLPSLL
jgi:hypothetical protein